jgi:protein gp37
VINKTNIEWTDFTANPIRFKDAGGRPHWHCEKISSGCANCYAGAMEHRFKGDNAHDFTQPGCK